MQKESKLSKIASSLKSKLIVPVLGAFLFAGCYTIIETAKGEISQPKGQNYSLSDIDRDGVPDLLDDAPFFYNPLQNKGPFIWFNLYHYNFPRFNPPRAWERYSHPPKDYQKNYFPPQKFHRNEGNTNLRNNNGNRGNNRPRQETRPPRKNPPNKNPPRHR